MKELDWIDSDTELDSILEDSVIFVAMPPTKGEKAKDDFDHRTKLLKKNKVVR